MNKKIVMWAAVMALVSAPALELRAQEGPGDEEEIEMMEGGPGGGPEMRPGMRGEGRGQKGPGMREEGGMGQERMILKKKMKMRAEKGGGGPGFMSEDEVLALITKHDPAFAKKVGDLREIAPGKYKMLIQMSG